MVNKHSLEVCRCCPGISLWGAGTLHLVAHPRPYGGSTPGLLLCNLGVLASAFQSLRTILWYCVTKASRLWLASIEASELPSI